MSMSTIFGNFKVFDGEISKAKNANYAVYKTAIGTELDGLSLPAYLRVFAPAGYTLLEDNTAVFIYGKISCPTQGPYLIEILNIFPYPYEPNNPMHGAMPSFHPRLCILGHVSGSIQVTYEGLRVFKVLSTAWVRDHLQATSFMAAFNQSPRWKKAPTSLIKDGSPVYIIGPLYKKHDENDVAMVVIEDIVFNAGSRPDTKVKDMNIKASSSAIGNSARAAWDLPGSGTGKVKNIPSDATSTSTIVSNNPINKKISASSTSPVPSVEMNYLAKYVSKKTAKKAADKSEVVDMDVDELEDDHPDSGPEDSFIDDEAFEIVDFPRPSESVCSGISSDSSIGNLQPSSPNVPLLESAKALSDSEALDIISKRIRGKRAQKTHRGRPVSTPVMSRSDDNIEVIEDDEPTLEVPRTGYVTVGGRQCTPHPFPKSFHGEINELSTSETSDIIELEPPTRGINNSSAETARKSTRKRKVSVKAKEASISSHKIRIGKRPATGATGRDTAFNLPTPESSVMGSSSS
ncbi:hypothetical protein M422DRAFT_247715 [Sphaerobolus stellatus SS14]|nr:hypothetical protein M422DRAFT_247715 [Sphaerobolus stellatus SS14]